MFGRKRNEDAQGTIGQQAPRNPVEREKLRGQKRMDAHKERLGKQFERYKTDLAVDGQKAVNEAKMASYEAGHIARTEGMLSKQLSTRAARLEFLKGLHGDGMWGGFKAQFQHKAEGLGGIAKFAHSKTTGRLWKATKYGAIGAAVLGGLAYVASTGRSKVTPKTVQYDDLEPENIGAMTPVVPEGPVLPSIADNAALGAQEDTTWRDRVRAGGPQGLDKMASAPTPSIAEDMRAEKVSTDNGYSLGA